MKPCTRCKQDKPLDEFAIDKRASDGRASCCKACMREIDAIYRANPEVHATRLAAQAKYRNSPQGQKMREASSKTPEAREQRKRYAHTPAGAIVMRDSRKRYRQKMRETQEGRLRLQAEVFVGHAVEAGRLPSASTLFCAHCGAPATQYHHYLGYEKPFWLTVIPLCHSCHHKAHLV